jgi:hypothetical protein
MRATPARRPDFRIVNNDQIRKMREAGTASSYFARLKQARTRRWVRVSATPMMLADRVGRKGGNVTLGNMFACVDEVSAYVSAQLETHVLTNAVGSAADFVKTRQELV